MDIFCLMTSLKQNIEKQHDIKNNKKICHNCKMERGNEYISLKKDVWYDPYVDFTRKDFLSID